MKKEIKPSEVLFYAAIATLIGWAIGLAWNTHDKLKSPSPKMAEVVYFE